MMGCATPRHTVLPSCMQATLPTHPSFSLTHPSPHSLTPSQRNEGESYPRSSLCPLPVKLVPICLLLPICLLSLPSDQPKLDWTLHVTDLGLSLKNHTLSSTLTHGTLNLNRSHPPSATNPKQYHSLVVFFLSSHFFSLTRTKPPTYFCV